MGSGVIVNIIAKSSSVPLDQVLVGFFVVHILDGDPVVFGYGLYLPKLGAVLFPAVQR